MAKQVRQLADANQGPLARAVGLSNQEIVTIAVYLLGGDSKPVDTEDVAIKAHTLAPGRFIWRKYPDQVDMEVVRKRLWDARRPEKNGWVLGSNKTGWSLTKTGLDFAIAKAPMLHGLSLDRNRRTLKERQWLGSERRRLLASAAYEAFVNSGPSSITPRQAEAFFRLDNYVLGELRERKILRILNAFSEDPELGGAVRAIAATIKENPL